MQTDSVVEYKINENDEITFLSYSWDRFARENDAPELVSEKVINRSLWDFITDETTKQLYKDMLKLVREGNFMEFKFNCDSSTKIRLMEMIITPAENGALLFQTRTISINERPEQNVLDRNAARTKKLISMCGWCKAIDTGNNDWKTFDIGISMLGLFEQDKLPALSHGICDTCYSSVSEKISHRYRNFSG